MLNIINAVTDARAGPLEHKLQSFAPLQTADLEAVRACHDDLRTTPAGMDVAPPGAGPDVVRLVVSGWAARARVLRDGRRQLVQIFLPGDLIGLRLLPGSSVIALTPVRTADAAPLATALKARNGAHAGLRVAWERLEALRQQQLLDHLVRLGRLSAYERTANLILDLMDRHRRAGLSDGTRMPWPLTQEMVADVLGLSIVHVNRTLQQLRREELIVLRAGQLIVPDRVRLAQAACWEPAH